MILILSLSLLTFTGALALPNGIGQGTLETAAIRAPIACPAGYTAVGGECIHWPRNVITVPPNCPEGQKWVDGACRDIWRSPAEVAPIVKLACPAGYAAVGFECIHWPSNVITVPPNCPEGQKWVDGACRDIWRAAEKVQPTVTLECPPGYSLVAGKCIDWLRNVVTVPSNCPEGWVWINGACRDIWRA